MTFKEQLKVEALLVTTAVNETVNDLPSDVSALAKFSGLVGVAGGRAFMTLLQLENKPDLRLEVSKYYVTQLRAAANALEKAGNGEKVEGLE